MEPAVKIKEDIESIMATIETVKLLADDVFEVLKDGKLTLKDIKNVPSMAKNINDLVVAVKGVEAEAKDLDPAEMKAVVMACLDLMLYISAKTQYAIQ